MKYIKHFALALAAVSLFTACKDDDVNPGNPVMNVTGDLGTACFGDTLRFSIKATDDQVPLSTIHAQLYFGSEMVSEEVIRTKVSGADYPVALYVPYLANIPDGKANLRLTLQNINFTLTEENYSVSIYHADYPELTFIADDGTEYTMMRESLYNYSMTGNYPQEMKGKIVTPKNTFGDFVTFGYEASEIKVNGAGSIPFSNSQAGNYTVSFNTYTFEGSPFVTLTINGELLQTLDDDSSYIDLNLAKGDILTLDGFPNFNEWWLNPDYFTGNPDGTLSFMAYEGNYRLIANLKLQYFKVMKLMGGEPATLNDDGTGAVWILGDGIGYPSLSNSPGWNPGQGICMAPINDKTYQVTVVGGRNVDVNSINFKFFGQDGWGTELTGTMLTSESDIIGVGTGDNGHDNGNLFLNDGVTLDVNGVYVITLDLTGGINNAILRTDFNGEQEFEEKPIYINGEKMITSDNSRYSLMMNLTQNEILTFTQFDGFNSIYIDPDYFGANDVNSVSLSVISGYYNIIFDKGLGTLSAYKVNEDGSQLTLQSNGSGALWLMGWGVGSPSLDSQFGWDEGKAYCIAQVAPSVYQFTGKAGPENGSIYGERFRFDYLSFKFFWQNGWGGEFNDDTPLNLYGTASEFIQWVGGGNFELAPGVELQQGETYRMTIDLSDGIENGKINYEKL